jgi:hypothetical protein
MQRWRSDEIYSIYCRGWVSVSNTNNYWQREEAYSCHGVDGTIRAGSEKVWTIDAVKCSK